MSAGSSETSRIAGDLGARHRETLHHRHFAKRPNPRRQRPRHRLGLPERDEDVRLGVLQNSSLALGILVEPVQAGRWVDRHGHTAGEERAEECVKEILLGPEQEPDRIPPPKCLARRGRRRPPPSAPGARRR